MDICENKMTSTSACNHTIFTIWHSIAIPQSHHHASINWNQSNGLIGTHEMICWVHAVLCLFRQYVDDTFARYFIAFYTPIKNNSSIKSTLHTKNWFFPPCSSLVVKHFYDNMTHHYVQLNEIHFYGSHIAIFFLITNEMKYMRFNSLVRVHFIFKLNVKYRFTHLTQFHLKSSVFIIFNWNSVFLMDVSARKSIFFLLIEGNFWI